mgnify:CR=1 FL=1
MSKPFLFTVFAVLAATLAGCVSPEEQAAQDRARCSGYGFVEGTNAFARCMMDTSMVREERQRQDMERWRAENERKRREDEWKRKEEERRRRDDDRRAPPMTPIRPGGVRQVDAGPIFSNISAQDICPRVCGGRENWDGNWRTVAPGRSTCDCRN